MQLHWHGSGAANSSTNWRQAYQQQPPRDSRQQEVFSFNLYHPDLTPHLQGQALCYLAS